MRLKRDEVIWAAGFFDGEGYVATRRTNRRTAILELSVTQFDPRPLERMKDALGVGKIYEHTRTTTKLYWCYRAYGPVAVKALQQVLPYLSEIKQEAALEALDRYRELRMQVRETRDAHCRNGHERAIVGAYVWKNQRTCPECTRQRQRRAYREHQQHMEELIGEEWSA